jgi:hypothetical protein
MSGQQPSYRREAREGSSTVRGTLVTERKDSQAIGNAIEVTVQVTVPKIKKDRCTLPYCVFCPIARVV